MVTQRGVRIISIELESHQANEFCALDRVHRIGGEQGDQDVIQLFAETHVCGGYARVVLGKFQALSWIFLKFQMIG